MIRYCILSMRDLLYIWDYFWNLLPMYVCNVSWRHHCSIFGKASWKFAANIQTKMCFFRVGTGCSISDPFCTYRFKSCLKYDDSSGSRLCFDADWNALFNYYFTIPETAIVSKSGGFVVFFDKLAVMKKKNVLCRHFCSCRLYFDRKRLAWLIWICFLNPGNGCSGSGRS